MMDKNYEGTGYIIVGLIVGAVLTWAVMEATHTQKKYKMNLKCVQGELYEEIKPSMFVRSHLECFEQRSY
jgi:uncharacterized membrane-anchored protein YhcB (DUF1043 family)